MSASNGQPRPAGEAKCDPRELPATVRLELALALHEGRALLTAAHVIEATLGPLAWGISPSQVRAVAASIRKLSPKLTERLINVCTRIERLALLTAERATVEQDSPRLPVSRISERQNREEENHE